MIGGIFALILLALLTATILASTLGAALESMGRTVRQADGLAADAAELRAALLDQQTGLRGYQLSGDEHFLQPYRAGLSTERISIDALIAGSSTDELRAAVSAVRAAADEWRSEWAFPQLDLVAAGDLDAVRDQVALGDGRRLFDEVRGALRRVDRTISTVRATGLATIGDAQELLSTVIPAAVIGYGLVLVSGAGWIFTRVARPLDRLAETAERLEAGEAVQFVPERDDEIGTLAMALDRLQRTVLQRYESAATMAERSTIFNRLGELVSYANDEDAIIRAGSAALDRLVPSRGGEVLLVNPSFDQLRVHSTWGVVETPTDRPLAVDRPTACPGIRRNAVHLTRSALDAFSMTCDIHPLRTGSLICVPMVSHNEVIGVIHVEREAEDAFDEEDTHTASRVAEQLALATANLRLMHRMERQAMTDPLTGLANARSFDPLVERELAIARRDGRPAAVLMLDLDHFKAFNDAHGHPAGDEALRAFARAVRGSLRETDTAARYGGEEFAILLRNTDLAGAITVAEKLRAVIEMTPIEIGPNRFARITASIGIASSDAHGTDRMQIMRLADAALYAAKDGRNRVAAAPGGDAADDSIDGRPGARPTSLRARVAERTKAAEGTSGL